MGLSEKTRELAETIKLTKEFNELKQAKAYIDKNTSLKNEVEEFSKMQLQLYSGKLSSREVETKAAELNKTYTSMSKIPEIDRYLKATKQFNDIMTNVYKSINEYISMNLK
jgi:cell fate (sporulation/competence/biofilm development) regulator YlbF (YheA/YmcA/DUF963 family)